MCAARRRSYKRWPECWVVFLSAASKVRHIYIRVWFGEYTLLEFELQKKQFWKKNEIFVVGHYSGRVPQLCSFAGTSRRWWILTYFDFSLEPLNVINFKTSFYWNLWSQQSQLKEALNVVSLLLSCYNSTPQPVFRQYIVLWHYKCQWTLNRSLNMSGLFLTEKKECVKVFLIQVYLHFWYTKLCHKLKKVEYTVLQIQFRAAVSQPFSARAPPNLWEKNSRTP